MERFLAHFLLLTFLYEVTFSQPLPMWERGFSDQYRSENTLGQYAFGYNEDHTSGGSFRREVGDEFGNKFGSYGLRIGDGRFRIVNYVADHNGYRADVLSNEPGVESQNSNGFLRVSKKSILGATVPGFGYSGEAPHVVFEPEVQESLPEIKYNNGIAPTSQNSDDLMPVSEYNAERLPASQYSDEMLPENQHNDEKMSMMPVSQYNNEMMPVNHYNKEMMPEIQYNKELMPVRQYTEASTENWNNSEDQDMDHRGINSFKGSNDIRLEENALTVTDVIPNMHQLKDSKEGLGVLALGSNSIDTVVHSSGSDSIETTVETPSETKSLVTEVPFVEVDKNGNK